MLLKLFIITVISSLLLLVPAGWDPGELEDKRYVSISSPGLQCLNQKHAAG